ncbi:protein-L-isoaspartate(D-aspartate) O-methyltransferase [Nitratireductor sp. ZSWI3]|uniref:protein-L-isoaspartate(D-aspartate) O-methyltransferase n=1 Tax=Nitratireductor sp. ZSWI3 TaxID=2966359 RepID=UPI00214FD0B1|nr:protein-L-isoaspartate(D-aspartate) O-methyltransferase [Nitratireductor sp. ZSWI3]MCR4264660.1 protein-L-isoaspartate(D-aspartate) O-methyltransferase [Nitratireductor sp. ZSWI3]
MLDYAHARKMMVLNHITKRGVEDVSVLAAMEEVPRERFVEPGMEEFAYDDTPLPIGSGQTISQPFVVAMMIEAAGVKPGDKVLEVGAGSGYAAAVLSRIAGSVYAIERHARLAERARARLAGLGYDNVRVRTGDGTAGWAEEAPFDAIIVSAAGTTVPQALRDQLDIGGCMVIPVEDAAQHQQLMRITRTSATAFEDVYLGSVAFVPLVGGQEPAGNDTAAAFHHHAPSATLPQMIARAAEKLPELGDEAFGRLFDRFADRRIVLLGEASHGTSEFYRARAAITRRLVEEHGFDFVAVEADWPDAAAIGRHVKGLPPRPDAPPFQRFPAWMWRNTQVSAFVRWLHGHNAKREGPAHRAGFYGLDIYNMSASIEAVLTYLDRIDREAAAAARERYGCLTPWQREPSTYGRAMLTSGYRKCEEAVIAQCRDLLAKELEYAAHDGEGYLDAVQNARLVKAAEEYYRIMYYGGAEAWNLRDRHMFETLEHVLEAHGPQARAVVWAHNSHIGDARHTEMGQIRSELNVGQLCRERFGDDVALIGFGTHEGTVAAADDWGGPMRVKTVRPSHEESYETLFHAAGGGRFLVDFARQGQLADALAPMRLERFIGVIYRPETEVESHYALASLSRQFDAFVWFDRTSAVTPFGTSQAGGVPDTFPFGV